VAVLISKSAAVGIAYVVPQPAIKPKPKIPATKAFRIPSLQFFLAQIGSILFDWQTSIGFIDSVWALS